MARTAARLADWTLLVPTAALAFSLLAHAQARPRERETPPSASPVPSEVRAACIQCHVLPPPDSLPRAAWEPTIYMMKGFALQGVGAPLGGPPPIVDFDLKRVVGYYESLAPVSLPSPEAWPALGGDLLSRFGRRVFRTGAGGPPLVANVAFLDLDGKGRPLVVAVDMADGLVLGAEPTRSDGRLDVLGRVPHPCHVTAADLDVDGHADLLVADLGVVAPGDDLKGSVVWLRRQPDGAFRAFTLADRLPRVADVQASDFDLDVVACSFVPSAKERRPVALPDPASIVWLEQTEPGMFARHTLERAGRHVSLDTADYDRDGDMDLLVGNFRGDGEVALEVWESGGRRISRGE
jgi:hypothetical protein